MCAFVDLQDRGGNAGLVVEIADGGVGVERRFKDRFHHFLGRGLADTAGDAHDRQIEPLAVHLRNVLIREHGVLHADMRIRDVGVGYGKDRAFCSRIRNEPVSVERAAADRNVRHAGHERSGVDGQPRDDGVAEIGRRVKRAAGRLQQFSDRESCSHITC